MHINEIREQRVAKVAELRTLLDTAEREGRSLTADEAKTFDEAKATIAGLEAAEQRQQFMDEAERRSKGTPVHGDTGAALESRVSLLTVLRAGMEGRSLSGAEAEMHTKPAVLTTLRGTLKAATAGSDYIATTSSIGELPAASSNAAPANAAILGDWSQVLVGQWGAVEILVNPYAETPYRRGGVLVRAMSTIDVALRHEQAFVVATGA